MDCERLLTAAPLWAAGLIAAAGLAGCDGGGGEAVEHQLAPARVYERVGRKLRWDTTPAERYGISADAFAASTAGDASATAGTPTDDGLAGAQLHWDTPAGWTELPPAMYREANFLVAGDERSECYLTTLIGEAGGMDANINRWRKQVSLPPLGPAEIADLPRVSWFGGEAIFVDFEGTWTGMAGDQAAEGWRLVGLAQVTGMQSSFLKMVGPADVIGPQIAAFRKLADSFHVDSGGAADHAASSRPAAATPDAAAPVADTQRSASLAWRTPPGWTRGPEKVLRDATYFAGGVECSVTLLEGSAGGVLANINRWCGQMGAPALTEADLGRLEHAQIAGADALLVQLSRGPGATAAEGQELLLGAVATLANGTLFVKMTGPRAEVESQRPALIEFCRSLEVLP
jgi:hypothetical protein